MAVYSCVLLTRTPAQHIIKGHVGSIKGHIGRVIESRWPVLSDDFARGPPG